MGRRSRRDGSPAPAGPTPAELDAQLDALYALVPDMADCKGLCYDSCVEIPLSPREQERIRERSGITIPIVLRAEDASGQRCPALTPVGRCSVYDIRPMVCRLFGTVQNMKCEHGCSPVDWLGIIDGYRLMAETCRIGGDLDSAYRNSRLADELARNPIARAKFIRSYNQYVEEHLR